MRAFGRALSALVTVALGPGPLAGQDSTAALRVFLDCQNVFCDFDFLRTEIAWVQWMRDRTDADVHVLVTSQQTGSGGREYTFRFIGLRAGAAREDQLLTTTPATATDDERRRAVARTLALGLAPHGARSELAPRLSVRFDPPPGGTGRAPAKDPWKNWVFSVGLNAWFSGQSLSSFENLHGSFSVRRITDDLLLRAGVSHSRDKSRFEFEDGDEFESITRSTNGNLTYARSLTDHWTIGLYTRARAADPENLDLVLTGVPGVEFSVWPYRESTRRLLTFIYEIGASRFAYIDTTIYGKIKETRAHHALTAGLRAQQPWGEASVSFTGSSFLDDWSQNRLRVNAGLEIRITRGLRANIFGGYARVRDQLYLPKEDATDEEVLLRLRRLRTSYEYYTSFGLSYTFGSIFNSIVNPRYRNAGGGQDDF